MNVKNVLNIPGTSEQIDFCIPEERLAQISRYVFASPVRVNGQIANRAGVVTLLFRINCSLLVTCDRCLKEMVQEIAYDEQHTVVRSVASKEDEENYVIARAECIDLVEIAVSDLILELPAKLLCREDCKGLCPVCGCDRNVTECGCMSER